MSDNLTKEQCVNRNLVKEYQDRGSDGLVKSLVNVICLQNANLEHDNKTLVATISTIIERNEGLKKDAEEEIRKLKIQVKHLQLAMCQQKSCQRISRQR